MRILLVFSILIAIVAVLFAAYNNEPQLVSFGPIGAVRAPLSVILLATLGLGVIVGILASVPATISARREVKRLRKGDTTTTTTARSKTTVVDTDEDALIKGKASGPGGFNPYEPIKP